MKLIVNIVIVILAAIAIAYYGSFFILPSVTVVNKSGVFIEQVEVALPSSNLNFGALIDGEKNTLHYSLKQVNGLYNYKFTRENSIAFKGSCGYVTSYEFHKRVVITLLKNKQVVCI
jgi:hypothetical protein